MISRLHALDAGGFVIALASLVGLAGFLYPFILPAVDQGSESQARAGEAPLLLAVITAGCLLTIVLELDRGQRAVGTASRTVALLGTLVAIDATLRLVPTFLGASPIFILIMLVGLVFGPAMGFQMGVLTLLVSAFITGGIGPWLPYQMLGAGWIGMSAGWLPLLESRRNTIALLAAFGGAWGLLYGALLNLWFWPFTAPGVGVESGLYWSPGLSLAETVERYARFYLVTSFGYDLFRAAGNVVLTLLLGGPLLAVLLRFHSRFGWEPWTEFDELEPALHLQTSPPRPR